jgi:hypothetical protein
MQAGGQDDKHGMQYLGIDLPLFVPVDARLSHEWMHVLVCKSVHGKKVCDKKGVLQVQFFFSVRANVE